jgi:pimeloyl-ACP methyl ester carboxylesterase
LLALLVGGCAAVPFAEEYDLPALQLRVLHQPSVVDGRVRFRQILCHLRPDGCETMLVRLPDEPGAADVEADLPAHDPRLRILFVPGAFQECFAEAADPYEEAVHRLRRSGYSVDLLPVGGRSSSERNAEQIAHAIRAQPTLEDARLVLVGYSKGTMDILVFLVRHPELVHRVDAVVSIAGAVNGTPIADRYSGLFDLVSWVGAGRCEVGDRGVVRSLRRGERMRWLAQNRLPRNVAYFSLGALTQDGSTAKLLAEPRRELTRITAMNDAQTLFYDQLIPGSTLLGYANGDHWAIALPLQERWPFWAGNSAGLRYPRDDLFEAIVLYLAEAVGR